MANATWNNRLLLGSFIVPGALLLCACLASAWGADDVPAAKPATKPKGPLPAQYAKVVDAAQRARIYAIQDRYKAELDKLVEQVVALKAKRDAEVEAVLSPEQVAKVKQLREEAAMAAAAKKAAAAAAGQGPATPPAATPAPTTAPPKGPAAPATKSN